jgi:uroporphyrinogen III methyltransferase / synthase
MSDYRPLKDKLAVVACSALKAPELVRGLESLGAEVIPVQVIEIAGVSETAAVRSALVELSSYNWVVFTSSNAVLHFSRFMDQSGIPPEVRTGLQVCAVGPGTSRTARQCGFEVCLVPPDHVAEGVVRGLLEKHRGAAGLSGVRILFPCALQVREVLARDLTAAGARVDVVPCYQTVPGSISPQVLARIENRPPDLMVFTSSSTVRNFVALAGDRCLANTHIAVLGPITAQTVALLGKTCEIIPRENTIPSLLEAVAEYWSQ